MEHTVREKLIQALAEITNSFYKETTVKIRAFRNSFLHWLSAQLLKATTNVFLPNSTITTWPDTSQPSSPHSAHRTMSLRWALSVCGLEVHPATDDTVGHHVMRHLQTTTAQIEAALAAKRLSWGTVLHSLNYQVESRKSLRIAPHGLYVLWAMTNYRIAWISTPI